jgi:hypothetical protein
VDASVETLWSHVLDHWGDEKTHTAFLQYCDQTNQLPEAAARYRGMAGDHTRAEVAEKKLKAVAVLALAKLESERTQPSNAPRSLLAWAALLLLTAAAFAVAYAYASL